jgi:hypothetical protein
MLTAIKARAPVTGGNFGVWGGMFSTFDCAVKGYRKKEDPYNSIIAGFLTGGSLAIRGGYKAARNGAIMCAIFLAVIEGVGIGIQRLMAENTRLDVSAHNVEHDESRLIMDSYRLLNLRQKLGVCRRERTVVRYFRRFGARFSHLHDPNEFNSTLFLQRLQHFPDRCFPGIAGA